MFNNKKDLKWDRSVSGDTITLSTYVEVNDRYSISAYLRSRVYEDSFKGKIYLNENDKSSQNWREYEADYICNSNLTGVPLREAKSAAEYRIRRMYKNILKNSFKTVQ